MQRLPQPAEGFVTLQVEDDGNDGGIIAETGYRDADGEMRRPWCPATRILEHRESEAQEREVERKRKEQQQSRPTLEDPKPELREDFPDVKVQIASTRRHRYLH